MPWDGSGNYSRVMDWSDDSDAAIKIRSDRHDLNDDDLAQAISNCLTKDGQSQPTANIPLNGHKLVQVADPTDPGDAANKKYVDAIKTFATNLDLSGADANGRINFTSMTGVNGIGWTGADLSWLARLATAAVVGPPAVAATINRLVLNDKPDGSGTDVIEMRENGTALLGPLVTTKGTSAQFQIIPTTGNGHVYWMAANGTDTRMIMYTSGAAQGAGIIQLGNGKSWQFKLDGGVLINSGAIDLQYNGNIYGVGSIWAGWGHNDAFTAISARIEARAQAWATQLANNCVQSTDCAGETAFNRNGVTGKWQNSGYFFTGVQGTSEGGDATYFARMPRRYIPARGWEPAFPF